MRSLILATSIALLAVFAAAGDFHGRALEGYLVDQKSADLQQYQDAPETYTVGQAKAALQAGTAFTVMVPAAASVEVVELHSAEEVNQDGDSEWQYLKAMHKDKRQRKQSALKASEPDAFGWANGKNPKEQRGEQATASAHGHHRRCHREHQVDSSAVEAYLQHRRPETYNHGHLKVRVTDTRGAAHLRQFSTQSASFRGMHIQSGTVTVEGYLTDIFCVNRVNSLDGVNMITNPQGHSKHCAVLSICIPDGFTILTPPATGATSYGPMYNLTTQGNADALVWLKTLDEWQRNLLVKQQGRVATDGKFQLVSSTGDTFTANADGSASTSTTDVVIGSTPAPGADESSGASFFTFSSTLIIAAFGLLF